MSLATLAWVLPLFGLFPPLALCANGQLILHYSPWPLSRSNLLVILGCILLFDEPSAEGASIVLVGTVIFVAEAALFQRGLGWSGFTFCFLLSSLLLAAGFAILWMNSRNLTTLNVDKTSTYLIIAAGIFSIFTALGSIAVFGTHFSTLLNIAGGGCTAYAGYLWLSRCAPAGAYENADKPADASRCA